MFIIKLIIKFCLLRTSIGRARREGLRRGAPPPSGRQGKKFFALED